MQKILPILILLILVGCMSQEEQRIKDFLNEKMSENAEKITNVKIIGEDSVLSFTPMEIMYNDCLHNVNNDSTYFNLGVYYYHSTFARNMVLSEQKKDPEFIAKHSHDWRRICKIKAKSGEKTSDHIEVIFDSDGITPIMIGREYDTDLMMWNLKIQSLPQNKYH